LKTKFILIDYEDVHSPDEDKRIGNPKLTGEQKKAIAEAKDINNSDVDLCEFKGKTVI
jgi:hypothetical protein